MRKVDPMGIFIMETKIKDNQLRSIFRSLGFVHFISVPPVGCKGGIVFCWWPGLQFNILKSTRFYFHLLFRPGNNFSDFVCSFVHGPAYWKDKVDF